MKSLKRWSSATVSTIIFLLFLTGCNVQKSLVSGNKRAYGYTWEEEKKLGAQSDEQIQQQYGVYDNESMQNYVDKVAQKVLSNSDFRADDTPAIYRDTEFTFRVLDSPVVNAFALPGGYVYVTRGLMANLRNEAQLAVVLGHEIGHVAARHASQRAFEQQVGQLALLGGAVGGELLGLPGGDILQLGSQATQLLFLKYSRDDESESDKLGVEYAAKSSFKAAEGADFFTTLKRLSNQSGQSVPTWASTHPDPSARESRIPKLAQNWSEKGFDQTIVHTDEYMSELDNIIYGNNPRQGFTRNGMFYHPDLEFKFPYPESWQLVNTPSAVQIVNQDQNAIIVFQIDGKNNSARASVNEFLSQDGVNPTGGNATSNNGLNGYEATATAQTQQGGELRLYLYSVEFDGNIYRYLAYSTAEQFNNYSRTFVNTTNGFDRLRDRSILDIQPVELNTFRANRTDSFRSFMPGNMPLDISLEDMAITNQVGIDETIEQGTWLKIPRQ